MQNKLYFRWVSSFNEHMANEFEFNSGYEEPVQPIFLPESYLPNMRIRPTPGYRSIYLYDEETVFDVYKDPFRSSLLGRKMYAREIMFDLDRSGGDKLPMLCHLFRDYSYSVWLSGGAPDKFHFILDTRLQSGHKLYELHNYVATTIDADLDSSIYRPLGIIALEGQKHWTTGAPKRFHAAHSGKLLDLGDCRPCDIVDMVVSLKA